MHHVLDEETKLTAHGNGVYSRTVTNIFWNMESAFGGWALALAMEAVKAEANPESELSSINAIFIDGIGKGEVFVCVHVLSQRKRTGFFRVELHKEKEDGPLLFSADIILSQRPETDIVYTATMPDVASPEEAHHLAFPPGMGPRWFGHFDQRIAVGKPFTVQEHPKSAVWMREGDGRPLDTKGLVTMSDVPLPRAFFLSDTPRFSSTVSYSLYNFAAEAELQPIGNEYVLVESESDYVRNGTSDQSARIWSRSGRLLAVTSQTAFFR